MCESEIFIRMDETISIFYILLHIEFKRKFFKNWQTLTNAEIHHAVAREISNGLDYVNTLNKKSTALIENRL